MRNYNKIKAHCENQSALSSSVVDDFLIHYAAAQGNLHKVMEQKFKKFNHITKNWPEHYVNFFKSEYIASTVFTSHGTINKLLNHSAIKALSPEEYQYLKNASENPWKLSFAQILDNPAPDFFEMYDVFRGETFLVFSPGVQDILKNRSPILWFNLIAFNGECYQTFGIVLGLSGLTPDDVFFMGTEIDPFIENDEDFMVMVEKNPLPFFMLLDKAEIPLVQNQNHVIAHWISTDAAELPDKDLLENLFSLSWNSDVFRLELKNWSEFPHNAFAYFDEAKGEMMRSAMTEKGFVELTKSLNLCSMELEEEAQINVSVLMASCVKDILKKSINLNPYEKLFDTPSQEDPTFIKNVNNLMQAILPYINKNKEIDIPFWSKKYDVDEKLIADLIKTVNEKRFGI